MSANWPEPSDRPPRRRSRLRRLPVLWEVVIVTIIILIAVTALWKWAYPASGS